MFVLVLALSVLIGLSLGVLGGGGSILTVPILVYVAGLDPKEAIATSLFVVGVTSAAGVVSHARGGRVMWRTGLLFGLAGMAGAFVGGLVGGHAPGQLLLLAFALMMVATSLAMLRGRRTPRGPRSTPSCRCSGCCSTARSSAWSPGSSAPGAASWWSPPWPCSAACRCRSRSAPRWSSSR